MTKEKIIQNHKPECLVFKFNLLNNDECSCPPPDKVSLNGECKHGCKKDNCGNCGLESEFTVLKEPDSKAEGVEIDKLIEEFVKISPEVWQAQKDWLRTAFDKVSTEAADIGYCAAADKCDSHSMEFIKQMEKAKIKAYNQGKADCDKSYGDYAVRMNEALIKAEAQGRKEAIADAIACRPQVTEDFMGYDNLMEEWADNLSKLK